MSIVDGYKLDAMQAIIEAARKYRAAEHEATPRIFRGKALHDLAIALDREIEGYDKNYPKPK